MRGVLRAVPRQGLGDPLDLVVGLVEAEVLAPERDDGGERHLAANMRVPFAEVVVVGGVGVAAVLVSDRRVDRLATFTLEPGAKMTGERSSVGGSIAIVSDGPRRTSAGRVGSDVRRETGGV